MELRLGLKRPQERKRPKRQIPKDGKPENGDPDGNQDAVRNIPIDVVLTGKSPVEQSQKKIQDNQRYERHKNGILPESDSPVSVEGRSKRSSGAAARTIKPGYSPDQTGDTDSINAIKKIQTADRRSDYCEQQKCNSDSDGPGIRTGSQYQ